ncbi:LytTR family transcriptional regulator [Aquiflexum sp. LQ15W]|uniref:LytR/AlgR family response regulator transcription factor n=1 Tax=Cognataquiflexum nitidum TaxID=2922272 RepID=UPI001F13B063|nr:LytTR family DNA-binding domain-containing protein [Cognataquiflexum nitidum]MCH6202085.1 LytTR family transcriptional regulator [Cognataquiflexum nitidum]
MRNDLQFALENEKKLMFKNKVVKLKTFKTEEQIKKDTIPKVGDYYQDRIAIPSVEGHEIFFVSKIIRCEADGNYSKIIYAENDFPVIVSRQLKYLESVLIKNGFLRIHHSHLINPFFIKKILKSEGGQVEMEGGTRIRISKNKEEIIKTLFISIDKI